MPVVGCFDNEPNSLLACSACNQELYQHNCPGNARFCEICGKPTYFATEGYLKPWNDVQDNFEDTSFDFPEEESIQVNSTEDDELPF